MQLPHRPASLPALVLACLAPWAQAQRHDSPVAGAAPNRAGSLAADLLVPIHTLPADPVGGAYGWWAAGDAFKCSFHDGFTFYPWVGPDVPENLPFAWRNTRVRVGDQPVLTPTAAPTHAHSDLRYEYRHTGVTEAYDVRKDGVEQTFTIARRPAIPGDLVVRGDVVTPLRAQPCAAAHQAIVFSDDAGKTRVTYGAAVAIDANGRRTPVATSFDGTSITLTVDARTVATAAYPLVIDPLTSATLHTFSGLPHFELAIQSSGAQVVAYFTRQFSGSDLDGYAVVTGPELSLATRTLFFSDITTAWSTRNGDVTTTATATFPPFRVRVVCTQRDLPAPQTRSTIDVYLHDAANPTVNSGTHLAQPTAAGLTQRYPHISGPIGNNGGPLLLVFQQDITSTQQNTVNSEVFGQRISMGTPTAPPGLMGQAFTLDTLPVDANLDREYPAVTRAVQVGGEWAVVWQERDYRQPGAWWRIRCAFVRTDGFTTGSVGGANHLGDNTAPVHHTRPRVDIAIDAPQPFGSPPRHLATYLTGAPNDSSAAGTAIETHRFDFRFVFPLIRTSIARHVVATAPTPLLSWASIAADSTTGSHWALTWQMGTFPTWSTFAARVGMTGGVVEQVTLYAGGATAAYHPAVCHTTDPTAGSVFAILYATNENPTSMNSVYGRQFRYPTTAANTVYGTGCRGTISANPVPNAGDARYTIAIANGAPSQPALLLMGAGSTAIPLASIGLGPCFLNVDGIVAAFPVALDTGGGGHVPMPLIDSPAFIGDLCFQWFMFDPTTAWPGHAALTPGLRAQVR